MNIKKHGVADKGTRSTKFEDFPSVNFSPIIKYTERARESVGCEILIQPGALQYSTPHRKLPIFDLTLELLLHGQLNSITSSSKKRKLASPGAAWTQYQTPETLEDTGTAVGSVEDRSSVSPQPPEGLSFLSSPPRPLPLHLQPKAGRRDRRSPSPALDTPRTTGSSASIGRAGAMAGPGEGARMSESLSTMETDGAGNRRRASSTAAQASKAIMMEDVESGPPRSSSPAIKRPASDLEDGPVAASQDVDMLQQPEHEPQNTLQETPENEQVSSGTTFSTASDESDHPHSSHQTTAATSTPNDSLDSSSRPPASVTSPNAIVPSVDEQIAKVQEVSMAPIQDGQVGFIVSYRWLRRVKARSSESKSSEKDDKEATTGDIGPIDNWDIVDKGPSLQNLEDESGNSFVPLRPGLTMGEDFEVFCKEAWDWMVKWHGVLAHSSIITRHIHNTNPDGNVENLQYEIYPPVLSVLKLRNDSSGFDAQTLRDSQALSAKLVASRSENFNMFLKRAKLATGISSQSKVRVWRILGENRAGKASGMITPAASRSASPAPQASTSILSKDIGKKLLIDLNAFVSLEDGSQRELLEVSDQTANEKYNGHMTLAHAGLGQNENIVLEERISGPGGGEWVSDAAGKTASRNGVPISVTKNGVTNVQNRSKPKSTTASGRSSPAPNAGMMTRGRAQRPGRTLGTCGLSNLGNTCYMNSALQCVRSVEELTQYFRLDKYEAELNPDNPLAHNGDIAKSYASLLSQMFAPNSPTSVAPRNFKHTIGRYGPSFSGYGQQDSQEFLGFLLDGLQEDLNRIQKKPYIEKPDSTDEMVHDSAALQELADKCWDIYKARNDSVIADLFAGTYKSTLVCPVCEKVSITFDPFNNLTLQIPIESVWSHEVLYFRLHGPPIRVAVDMDRNGSIKSLKEYVAAKVKTDPRRLHAVELYKSKVYKVYEDYAAVSESIQSSDDVGIFELEDIPTNFPAPKRKAQKARSMLLHWSPQDEEDTPSWDSPLAEKMLVPIFHRTERSSSSRFSTNVVFGNVQYIILDRNDVRDYDAVLRKILSAVDTMTTFDLFQGDGGSENGSAAQEDDDMVVTTSEDADSSADGKVKTNSLDGEDGFVDVTMKDVGNTTTPSAAPAETLPEETRKSKILRSGRPIPSRFKNLFQTFVFQQAGELIPTGWNSYLEEGKDFVNIESRIPQTPLSSPPSESQTDQFAMPGDGDSSESEDELDNPPEQINNSFEPPGSDSDSNSDDLPSARSMLARREKRNTRTYGGKKNSRFNGDRTKDSYSKKGKNSNTILSSEESDDGPLIRVGEGILLDWEPHAYQTLFAGNGESEMRGSPTWERMDLLPDEELKQRRTLRQTRRRKGVSLGDCLDEFGKEEILSEADAWYCPRCKEHRRASKKFELWKSPDILIIHLKRFSASRGLRDKLDVLVDFPIEGLDFSERVAMQEEGKSNIYDLFAVDNHYGGLGGGHYTAMAQNFVDKNWYDYNDTMVSKRSPEHAVSTSAYLLFYRRRSDRPLGGPTFEKIIDEANHVSEESSASSRGSSPAGDGQRLGDHSRDGSPRDSQGAEAGVRRQGQAGGSTGVGRTPTTKDDDDLPTFSDDHMLDYESKPRSENEFEQSSTDDAMGFGQSWSFGENLNQLNQMSTVPPGSEDEDNPIDGASDRAANGSLSGNMSDRDNRMADFEDYDDDGLEGFRTAKTTGDETFQSRDSSPPRPVDNEAFESAGELRVKAPMVADDAESEEAPVAEVHVEEGEGLGTKTD